MTSDISRIAQDLVEGHLSPFEKLYVGGLHIGHLDRSQTAQLTVEAARLRRGRGGPCLFFTTSNGQVISLCASEPHVRALYEQADLISPDGMPVVKASRYFFQNPLKERVATTDAFHDAAMIAQENVTTFYFLGATPDMNRKAVEGALKLYPKLSIVGHRDGYFSRLEEANVIEEINRAAPDVLWIGLGVPRQQDFVVRNRHLLDKVGVAKTCGGLFDFLSGKNGRAPDWMQNKGLEWLYRVALEPRRLFWRYFITNPHAIYVLATQSGPKRKPR